jgi:hypothetical protein
MKRGRGSSKYTPGEFRRTQVWIGGTRPGNAAFVPPPANELDACLEHFERFLHDQPEPPPPLVKAGLRTRNSKQSIRSSTATAASAFAHRLPTCGGRATA